MKSLLKKFILILSFVIMPSAQAVDYSGLACASKYFLTRFGLQRAATLCHELGHALTARFLYNNPIDFSVGIMRFNTKATWPLSLDISRLSFTIGGLTSFTTVPAVGAKTAAILAAGPSAGVLFHYLSCKWLERKNDPTYEDLDLYKFHIKGAQFQIFSNLTVSNGSDGVKLLRALKLNNISAQLALTASAVITALAYGRYVPNTAWMEKVTGKRKSLPEESSEKIQESDLVPQKDKVVEEAAAAA